DPDSPLGHHGFVDSPNHGPRGTALVEELIPHLESRFRLVARPEARVVTGHSSGGWTSLWLQLRWPEVFGACWSSAPDPIDFRAFQSSNLYEDPNLYVDAGGRPTPSYRTLSGRDREHVAMTVREEALMEYAIHPLGASGQQWDAWEAMFSPRDPETGLPRPMYDAVTGRIDPVVVEAWKKYDIGLLLREHWDRYGPVMTGRVRLACGTLDSFYLNHAVELVRQTVEQRAGDHPGPGYVLMVEGATHGSVTGHIFARWNSEMREHFAKHGLAD
ncbi:MAG: alpha/beta hydrolase-fold protein, partial [Planctomycetota bacterium]